MLLTLCPGCVPGICFGSKAAQISFFSLCPLNPNQKPSRKIWGEENVIKTLIRSPPPVMLMLNELRPGITDPAGRKALTVSCAWMEKPLLSGMCGDCLCVSDTQ